MEKPAGFPPGPPRIPLAGSVPFLRGIGVEKIVNSDVASYGPVTGLFAGMYPMIMVNDWKLAKSLFAMEEFSGRLCNYTTDIARSFGRANLGIVWADGPRWVGQKNFTVKQLKNFGFGKKDLEDVIVKEANDIVDHMLSNGDCVLIDSYLFGVSALNVLWNMVAGYSFNRKDEELKWLLDLNTFLFKSQTFYVAVTAPWIRYLFPSISGYNKWLEGVEGMKNKIRSEIKNHESDLDENCPRDYIDSYLIEMRQNPDDPEFCKEQLIMIGMDLMSAGSETTSTFLMWSVLYMVLYPEVQEKCQLEIEEHIGQANVSLNDFDKLNYCQATIAEVLRVSQVAVSTVYHRVIKKVTLPSGHIIPEGSIAMSNIKKFLTDPLLWDKPEVFSPDRFLDDSNKFFKPEYFVPLGHGKRVCMGEPLAKAELFIFFVTLVQRISFTVPNGTEPDPKNYSAGHTRVPDNYMVTVKQRLAA